MAQLLRRSPTTDWLWWLLRRRRLMRVTGRSMIPTLQPGDLLFIELLSADRSLQEDDLVVALHPQREGLKIIKRIGAIFGDGRYFLVSDNPLEGTDSRSFGAVPHSNIVGYVTGYAIKMTGREEL
ncbi:MAG: nickel-type superoxide dismutase maturation protease [Caldilineaceae bacterium]|nr:nickel-type superoxide dismutase maturation protease [Caldilineaceae bacterium]